MSNKPDEARLAATVVAETDNQSTNVRQFVPRGRGPQPAGKAAARPITSRAYKTDENSGDDDDPGPSAA